ncbi:MAG: TonB family protein [Brevundimonas sp.]|uniref:TonB family protein n=1 Tax=Brevundimonas sp. TaxID=1871086 RepID=UPI00262BD139|nr:TonB family protein [Brevundimonas sp.]MDI6625926.1 TonB family protein [Brevundimonas sp.]MDQ7814122.1 TonB family protein [Brevundimonas sp.]
MMIRTAGGPGLVSPFDYNERRTPRFTRTTWIAVAVVAAGHVGLGAALYYQRFEMTVPAETPTVRPTIVQLVRPKPPEPLPAPAQPQAPNTLVNELPAPPATDNVLPIIQGETVATGPTISTIEKSPEPIESAPAATTPPRAPAVITSPSWIRQPSADQLMRAYPDRALRAEVGGLATVNCLVQPNGRVADCNLTSETPGGYGFGRAAQGLTRHFQISPRTVDGAAVGSRVNIAIRFNPPAD